MEGSSRCASLLLDWNVGAPRFPNEKEGPVVQKSYISFKIGISLKKLTITVFLLKSACDEGLHRKPGKNYVCECENRHHQRFEYEISIAGIKSQIKENGCTFLASKELGHSMPVRVRNSGHNNESQGRFTGDAGDSVLY